MPTPSFTSSTPVFILASQSRDRAEMFRRAALPFEVVVSSFDERFEGSEDPAQLVQTFARGKVENVAELLHQRFLDPNQKVIIIGGDTMVAFRGRVIGKAADEKEAFRILRELAGETHELWSGIAVLDLHAGQWFVDADLTHVTFDPMTDEEIWAYIRETGEYRGRAGAYSIRDRASLFVSKVEGSPSTVIGLPMHLLARAMRVFEINPFLISHP